MAEVLGGGGTKEVKKEERADSSAGRTVRKRKIRELVESVDPEERLSDDVEDVGSVSFFAWGEGS